MIGHHDPLVQHVPAFVKMPQCVGNKIGNLRPSQMTSARAPVKIAFNLAAKIARDFFLGIVDGLAAAFKMLESTQPFSLFPFEVQQYFSRQRIGQTKRHEVGRALAFHMREVAARVNARAKWILNFGLCTTGTQLMTRSLQARTRLVSSHELHNPRMTIRFKKSQRDPTPVAQVSKPAVSPISKSAPRPRCDGLRGGKPAIQQRSKSALRGLR